MVLAYRLRRPVPRDAALLAAAPYLAPAVARLEHWCGGATLLAESGDGASDFALMRAAEPGARGWRTADICAGDGFPAKSGGPSAPHPQEMAGSDTRVLLPLDASSPAPTP
jgi:hypothetical protein